MALASVPRLLFCVFSAPVEGIYEHFFYFARCCSHNVELCYPRGYVEPYASPCLPCAIVNHFLDGIGFHRTSQPSHLI